MLSVARATVRPQDEPEYLSTIHKLSMALGRRGQRLWVFRSPDKPGTFLEFSESPTAMSHRVKSSRTGEELNLEKRLQEIVRYEPGSWDLWEEVVFEEAPRKSEGWNPDHSDDGEE